MERPRHLEEWGQGITRNGTTVECRVPWGEDWEVSLEESVGEVTLKTLRVMLNLAFLLKVVRSH